MVWETPEPTGDAPDPRTGHDAVCLDGVRLMASRDFRRDFRRDLCAYEYARACAMAWSSAHTSARAPLPDLGAISAQVYGGWDYTADGDGYDFRDDLAILDTSTWTWTRPEVVGKRPAPRVGHSLVALGPANAEPKEIADGPPRGDDDDELGGPRRAVSAALYLFGGRAQSDAALDDLYMLRPLA